MKALEINYYTGEWHNRPAKMIIDLDQVAKICGMEFSGFSQAQFRKLLNIIDLSDDREKLAAEILKHLKEQLKELPDFMIENSKHCQKVVKLAEILKKHFNMTEEETTGEKNADENQKTTNEKEEKTMMNTKFFEGINTLEELRNKYRDLLKENHPDNGGDTETMQEINAQYSARFKALKAGAKIDDETTGAEKYKWSEVQDEAIREALNKIIHLHGINIEIVGSWIWIDGETFANKDALKEAGYKWSNSRKKWHFAPYESKWHKGGKKSFDELRRKYGSSKVENEKQEAISA